MAIGDPLPAFGSLAPPLTLAQLFAALMLPKSQSNVTSSNIPSAIKPAGPYDFLNSMTGLSTAQSEARLREQQGPLYAAQAEQARQQALLTGAQAEGIRRADQPLPSQYLDSGQQTGTGASTYGTGASGTGVTAPQSVSDVTAGDTPEWRAFATALSIPESGGRFNVRYTGNGGTTFDDLSRHPNIAEPIPNDPQGRKSTAAGAWQILYNTWNTLPEDQRPDFQPPTQYAGFKTIAARDYATATGRDLESDLKAGNLDEIQKGLVGTWPTIGKALKAYPALLANYTQAGTQIADNAAPSSTFDMPDTSLAGAGQSRPQIGGTPQPVGGGMATNLQSPQLNGVGQPPTGIAAGPVRLAQNGPLAPGTYGPGLAGPTLPGSLAPQPPPPAPPASAGPSVMPAMPGALAPLPASPIMPGAGMQPGGAMQRQINPAYIQALQLQDRLNAALGRRNPIQVEEGLRMLPGGSLSPQYLQQKSAAEGWGGVQPKIYEQWNTPKTTRAGVIDPRTGQVIGAMPQLEKVVDPATGREVYRYMSPVGQQAPGGGGAPGFVGNDLGIAKLGPGEIRSAEVRATKEQDDRQTVINEANAALQSRATLMNMANEAGNFVQGPFAQHAQTAASYLRLINPNYNGQVASYEDFVKNAGQFTRAAVKETSSRAAVQEFNMIQATLPSPTMSPIGLQRVQNELIGLTDYRLAKAQAQQQWEQQHGGPGNVTGFETYFQRAASPDAFIVARMDQSDRKEMYAKLQASPDGRRELARLGEQLTFLKQTGLAQ